MLSADTCDPTSVFAYHTRRMKHWVSE